MFLQTRIDFIDEMVVYQLWVWEWDGCLLKSSYMVLWKQDGQIPFLFYSGLFCILLYSAPGEEAPIARKLVNRGKISTSQDLFGQCPNRQHAFCKGASLSSPLPSKWGLVYNHNKIWMLHNSQPSAVMISWFGSEEEYDNGNDQTRVQ